MINIESIHYLCFGAGGANGWVYVGVLQALEEELAKNNNVLYTQIKGVSGSSVGSIMAVAVILQYNALELSEFMFKTINKYAERLSPTNLLTCFDNKGILDTAVTGDLIKDMIALKLGQDKRDITFAALFERTRKILALGAQNITLERPEILDHQSTPTMPVWKAVSMSCAIPLFFQPVEYNNNLYLDAGMSNPIPYSVFPLHETMVCYIEGYHGTKAAKDMSVFDYFCRIIHAFEQATHLRIEALPPDMLVRFLKLRIPCQSFSENNQEAKTRFQIDEKNRTRLIEIGRTTTLSKFHYKTALLTQVLLANAHINKFKQA